MSSRITAYRPQPITFSHGQGVWLWSEDHQQPHLDALAGIAVCGLGHAHPRITAAITEQAGRLIHTSNVYRIAWCERLAEKLAALSGMSQMFFTNSGAEANEGALKLAKLFGHQKGVAAPKVVVTEGAFHGRTLATLSASGSHRVHDGFEPLVAGFIRVPFNDLTAIERVAAEHPDVVAILVEPIQGENGIRIPDVSYLSGIRQLCHEHEWLMMLDEIQTGVGRTGSFLHYQQHHLIPDVCTMAKALGNGVPIGAVLMHGPACDLFQPGKHGSTFGGNPLACRVACEVLSVIEEEQILERVNQQGQALRQQLQNTLTQPCIRDVRGRGLMMGVELDHDCRSPLLQQGLKHQVLFSVQVNRVIRLVPALIISPEEVEQLVQRLAACIDGHLHASSTTT